MIEARALWELKDAIARGVKASTSGYPATYSHKDADGTHWVTIQGSEEPVPATGLVTSDTGEGDSIRVSLDGGSVSIIGNDTNPSVGAANVLRMARIPAAEVQKRLAATIAKGKEIADQAKRIAEAVGQHVWTADDGLHLTEATEEEFTDTPQGRNMLLNAYGFLLREADTWLASFTEGATAFFDGLGNEAANIVAQFGADGAVIGRSNESHQVLDYHSLQLVDKEGKSYFHVSDLRDHSGTAEITVVFTGDGSKRTFSFDSIYPDDTSYTVTVSDGSGGTPTKSRYNFMFLSAPSDGATISATYKTSSTLAKAYTAGLRHTDEGGHANIGAMSFAEGYDITSSGGFAHSEGAQTVASSYAAHSEGVGSTASQLAAHAEGWFTKASGYYSHAEGWHSVAKGNRSHAQNEWTIADYEDQTAMGRFNANSADHALEIGNGTYDDARSNAFAVGWDGTVETAKPIPKASGGTGQTGISTSSVTLSGCTAGGQRCWHNGVCCSITMIDVKLNAALANGGSVAFGTIPSGYRPSQVIYDLASSSNATFCGRLQIRIDQNGQLGIVNRSGSNLPANTAFSLFVTYAI